MVGKEETQGISIGSKKEAPEFYGLLPSRKEIDLEWLIKKFRDHYGSCESEQALRLEWQQSEQREDESLETYHCRFQKLVVRSMPNENIERRSRRPSRAAAVEKMISGLKKEV